MSLVKRCLEFTRQLQLCKILFNFYFYEECTDKSKNDIHCCFTVINNFITAEEEASLIEDIEPQLKRLRYEYSHWDDAIHGYREKEIVNWSKKAEIIIKRQKDLIFGNVSNILPYTHVLDLAEDGVIKPHVDSIRFCGSTVSGICLLSTAVMRLVKENDKSQVIDVLLPRRCLYVMKEAARYEYTHEVLGNNDSFFNNEKIKRARRISVICRNKPDSTS